MPVPEGLAIPTRSALPSAARPLQSSRRPPGLWPAALLCLSALVLTGCEAGDWRASPYSEDELVALAPVTADPETPAAEPSSPPSAGTPDTSLETLLRSDLSADPSLVAGEPPDPDLPAAAPTTPIRPAGPVAPPGSPARRTVALPQTESAETLEDASCPQIYGVLADALRQRRYVPGNQGVPEQLMYELEIRELNGLCQDPARQRIEITLAIRISRGPHANPDGALIRYVLGMIDSADAILARDTGTVLVPWDAARSTRIVRLVHHFRGSTRQTVPGPKRMVAGLLLQEHELADNREPAPAR